MTEEKRDLRLAEPANKNVRVSAVKTCPLDPADLLARFHVAAAHQGFRAETIATVGQVPLVAFTKRARGAKPRIYLSSGIHGDEPAPPEALLALLQSGCFDERATWFLVPMLNPTGFLAHRRENEAGIDLNRDYRTPVSPEIAGHVRWLESQPRFDIALCLHEDWEAEGFYLYELNASRHAGFAHALRAAGAAVLPIDANPEIDGRPIDEPAIIRPESDPALRETWPEAIYLRQHHTDLCYTIETPSSALLDDRLKTHAAVCRCAIEAVLRRVSVA